MNVYQVIAIKEYKRIIFYFVALLDYYFII